MQKNQKRLTEVKGLKCTACKDEAILRIKRHHVAFCQRCFIKFIQKQTIQAIKKYHMFSKKEPVLLAVSGGKDSMALWSVLSELDNQITTIHLDLGIPNFSDQSRQVVQQFAKDKTLPLVVIYLKELLGYTLPELQKKVHRPACSVCGLTKRFLLNHYAYHHHFSVLATGHNLDDEAATLLGNILRWREGYLRHQSPCLPSDYPGLVKKVKPFYTLTDEEILCYVQQMKIPFCDSICPLSQKASSLDFKKALKVIEDQSPGTKHYFLFHYLEKKHDLFPEKQSNVILKNCSWCGMPTTQERCSFCSILERTQSKSQLFIGKDDIKP